MASRRFPTYVLAGAAVLPILVWWLGWYPGFASSDTIDQLVQARTEVYYNHHPALHTFYLDLLSLDTNRPGLVTLLQVFVFGGLMVYAAKRLVESGAPAWIAVGAAWLLGLSPAIAPMTIGLWKDVVFTFFFLWAWTELLHIANARPDIGRATLVRLGVALAGLWLIRGNGPITVVLTLAALAWVFRRSLGRVALVGAVVVGGLLAVTVPLYRLLGVSGDGIEPAQVFLADVAAAYLDDPSGFTAEEVGLLIALAPIEVWEERYTCFDSTTLLFDPRFDHSPVRADPAAYRGLVFKVMIEDLPAVVAHRACAANFIFQPAQPAQDYFQPPQEAMPDNDLGLVREPISWRAYQVTHWLWSWSEVDQRLWLTWRPGLLILPALTAIVVFAFRARRFLIPSSLFVAHLINITVTSPAQEFRFAYPLYVVGALTLCLLYPTFRASRGDPA